MHRSTFRRIAIAGFIVLLLVACTCGEPPAEKPPPDTSESNIIELILGLLKGRTRFTSEPFVITTPSGAIIPAPTPGTEFTVAVGSDDVTIVQAHSGTVEVYAAGTWRTLEADEQTVIEPGEAPTNAAPAIPLDRDSYLQNPDLGGR